MKDHPDLRIHEAVLLLALKDEEGTFHWRHFLPAMGAGILAELLLDGWIRVEKSKKALVESVREGSTGDPVMDETLEKIRHAKRRAPLKTWVMRLRNLPKLQHKVARGLCRRGVLREDEGRVLALFKRRIYPQVDPRPERRLIEQLRRAIFFDTSTLNPRVSVLVAIAQAADLLSIPFEKSELKRRKKRIQSISKGDTLGKATQEAVAAAQAAIMVAVILPSVTSTAAG